MTAFVSLRIEPVPPQNPPTRAVVFRVHLRHASNLARNNVPNYRIGGSAKLGWTPPHPSHKQTEKIGFRQ